MIQVTLAISEFMIMLIWAGVKVLAWFGGIALLAAGAALVTGMAGRRLFARFSARKPGE